MAGANRVGTHRPQNFQLTLQRAGRNGATQRTKIVVQTDALDIDRLTIQEKALIDGKLHRAYAQRRGIGVHRLPVHRDRRDHLIQIGRVGRPALRIGHNKRLVEIMLRSRRHTLGGLRIRHRLAQRIEDHRGEDHVGGNSRCIRNFGAQTNGCPLIGNVGGRDVGAPVSNVNRVHFRQPDVAIHTSTRIPATAIRLDINPDGDVVWFPAKFHMRCKVVTKPDIAIRAASQQMPVDPDLAVHIHTVKVDGDFMATIRLGQGKNLPIPPDASG